MPRLFGRGTEFPRDIHDYRNRSVIERLMRDHDLTIRTAELYFDEMVKFLRLCADSHQQLAPSEKVDWAWHAFILHMRDYERFCKYYFGQVIYHDPADGADPKAFERTRRAYDETYGGPAKHTVNDGPWPSYWLVASDPGPAQHASTDSGSHHTHHDASPAPSDGGGHHGGGGDGGHGDTGGSSCGGGGCASGG